MGQKTLTQHYEEKYRKSTMDRHAIRLTSRPRDRYEGAFHLLAGRSGNYLEIGAGEGRLAASLDGVFENMWLVELAASRVRQMQTRFSGRDNVRVVEGNAEDDTIQFPEAYFDAVALVAVVEHLIDPIRMLNKIHRALRAGGQLVLETPNMAKYSRRIKLLSGVFPSTATRAEGFETYDKTRVDLMDEGHMHYFTYSSLRNVCLEYAGFKSFEAKWYGSWATTRAPALLARLFPSLFSECLIVATK